MTHLIFANATVQGGRMPSACEKGCKAAGLDPMVVSRIAKGLSRYAKEAQQHGLLVFGGSGSGTLRYNDEGDGEIIVADLDGLFDGGAGDTHEDAEGLTRGEKV